MYMLGFKLSTNIQHIKLRTNLNRLVVGQRDKKWCFELYWSWVIVANTNDKGCDHRIKDEEFCHLVFQKCYRRHDIPIPRIEIDKWNSMSKKSVTVNPHKSLIKRMKYLNLHLFFLAFAKLESHLIPYQAKLRPWWRNFYKLLIDLKIKDN